MWVKASENYVCISIKLFDDGVWGYDILWVLWVKQKCFWKLINKYDEFIGNIELCNQSQCILILFYILIQLILGKLIFNLFEKFNLVLHIYNLYHIQVANYIIY